MKIRIFSLLLVLGALPALAANPQFELHAWGRDSFGQASVPEWVNKKNPIYVDAGFGHTVGLFDDGTMFAFGLGFDGDTRTTAQGNYGQAHVVQKSELATYGNAKAILAVRAGDYHTLVLLDNGWVICFGKNTANQCTPIDTTGYDVLGMDAGANQNLLYLQARSGAKNRYLYLWGDASFVSNQLLQINPNGDSVAGITAMAGGVNDHPYVYSTNANTTLTGAARHAGANANYDFPAGATNAGFGNVRAMGQTLVALKTSNGSLTSWGFPGSPGIGWRDSGSGLATLSAGLQFLMYLGSTNPKILYNPFFTSGMAGADYGQTMTPADVAAVSTTAIAAGAYHSAALIPSTLNRTMPHGLTATTENGNLYLTLNDPFFAASIEHTASLDPTLANWQSQSVTPTNSIMTSQGLKIDVSANGTPSFYRIKATTPAITPLLTKDEDENRNMLSPNRRQIIRTIKSAGVTVTPNAQRIPQTNLKQLRQR